MGTLMLPRWGLSLRDVIGWQTLGAPQFKGLCRGRLRQDPHRLGIAASKLQGLNFEDLSNSSFSFFTTLLFPDLDPNELKTARNTVSCFDIQT